MTSATFATSTAALITAAIGLVSPTWAADQLPRKAAVAPVPSSYDWTGPYIGFHTGYGWGTSGATGTDHRQHDYGGPNAGVHAGYQKLFSNGVVLGVEGDFTAPDYQNSNVVMSNARSHGSSAVEELDYSWTIRARLGYAAGNWLTYVTGGLAGLGERFYVTAPSGSVRKELHERLGWAAGAGVEYAFAPQWRARLEYLYSHYDPVHIELAPGETTPFNSNYQTVRIGLTRQLGATRADSIEDLFATNSDRWEIHGQTTYLPQGHGRFRSPYAGANSLTASPDLQATWSTSLFLNARLWEGGEIYFNPELFQGFGFNNTTGLGGFPNGEAQKSNFPLPRFNASRLLVRQTFGFGGEQETLESGPMQLGGKVDVSRLTVQAGKFAVVDIFDGNSYAKDTRADFMNWSMWAPGAFDYAADRLGLTYGATAELNQKNWAVRAGYFLMDDVSNSNGMDMRLGRRGSYVLELETRYSLFNQPGRVRTIGWINSAYSGSYSEALAAAAATGATPDLTASRRGRIKWGYVLNVEQALASDIGLFGRWSWNDGKTEIMSFTDIDSSLSLGASIKGVRWNRPKDTIGIGGAINGLSTEHRDFIAAGGLGILIGDGRLNYRQERILEAYYSFAINKNLAFTADYQFITNPAYNADRGPVSIFSGRLHGEF